MKDSQPQQHRPATAPRHIGPVETFDEKFGDEETIDLTQYWRTVKRHKWGILSITLMALIIGTLYALSATPIYQASTILLADPKQPTVSSNQDQYVNTAMVYLFYETQYGIIGSHTVAEKVVAKLGLVEKHKTEKSTEDTAPSDPDNIIQQLKAWKKAAFDWRQWLPEELKPEPDLEPTDLELQHQLATSIQGLLKVKGGKQSSIISVSYESKDPQLAADVVNAVADAYIEFGLNSRFNSAKKNANWLNEQLTELKENLKASELALETYQKRKGLIESSQQQSIATTQLSTLNRELIRAQTKRSEAEILYNQVKSLSDKEMDYASLGPVLNSETVEDLLREVTKASRRVNELNELYSKRYRDTHPEMIVAKSDLEAVNQRLKLEMQKYVNNIKKDYQATTAHEKQLKSLIRKQKGELSDLKGVSFELAQLERNMENDRKIYENFLSRFQEANISEEYDASNIRIVDSASVPSQPTKPRKRLIVLISGVLGLFLGLMLAFLREALDNTFKTTDNIEEKLGIPSLGLTAMVKAGRKSVIPERQFVSDPRSQFSENINNIRTGLLFSNIDHPPQVTLVTSATGAEGKSTLAANLAASLGQLDNTLLLEVDLRKPSLANTLKITRAPGLSDLVANQAAWDQIAISKVGKEDSDFYAVTCGTLPPNPLELISSQHFQQILEKLKARFKYIVLDAPPILAVSDAAVLGQLSDSVIMAVKAESTTIKMAQEAVSRLKKSNVHVTGAVLTQAEPRRMSYYGGHYYHASYYGYKDPETGKAA